MWIGSTTFCPAGRESTMNDSERLLAAFSVETLIQPNAERLNIVDLARALAAAAGVDGVGDAPGIADLIGRIGQPDHLVFILADGLGLNLIHRLPEGSFLRRNLSGELRTVFPSSSSVALTSLATCEWPSHHAVTGQWTHIPELASTAGLLQYKLRQNGRSLLAAGFAPEKAFPLPALIAEFDRDVLALYPGSLIGSVSTAYFCGGVPHHGYHGLHQGLDAIVHHVEQADRPSYTYLYAPRIDQEAHHYGVTHHAVDAAVRELDHELTRLERKLAGKARVVLTADHGLLDAATSDRFFFRPSSDLFAHLKAPPSGDSRVMYLHTKYGAEDEVRQRLRQRLDERFFIITRDEANQLRLFGPEPLSAATSVRIGDLIVLSAGSETIEYLPGDKVSRVPAINAHHSGLTPAEMLVPLILF
jgi:hypothetical protein